MVHDAYAFCTVLAQRGGAATIRYCGYEYRTDIGQVQAFVPGEVQICDTDRGASADYRVLFLDPELVARVADELECGRPSIAFRTPLLQGAFATFVRFHAVMSRHEEDDPLRAEQEFVTLANLVVAHLDERRLVHNGNRACVRRAREYVEDCLVDDLARRISLDELAAAAGANGRFALCHDFTRALGISPHAYVKARKMTSAADMLRSGLGVTQTAWRVGYSLAAFSRAFFEHWGVPASLYGRAFAKRCS